MAKETPEIDTSTAEESAETSASLDAESPPAQGATPESKPQQAANPAPTPAAKPLVDKIADTLLKMLGLKEDKKEEQDLLAILVNLLKESQKKSSNPSTMTDMQQLEYQVALRNMIRAELNQLQAEQARAAGNPNARSNFEAAQESAQRTIDKYNQDQLMQSNPEPSAPPMDQEPSAPPMDQEPSAPPMDQEPSAPPLDEEPSAPSDYEDLKGLDMKPDFSPGEEDTSLDDSAPEEESGYSSQYEDLKGFDMSAPNGSQDDPPSMDYNSSALEEMSASSLGQTDTEDSSVELDIGDDLSQVSGP